MGQVVATQETHIPQSNSRTLNKMPKEERINYYDRLKISLPRSAAQHI